MKEICMPILVLQHEILFERFITAYIKTAKRLRKRIRQDDATRIKIAAFFTIRRENFIYKFIFILLPSKNDRSSNAQPLQKFGPNHRT